MSGPFVLDAASIVVSSTPERPLHPERGLRLDGNAVWLDGALVGRVEADGKRWVAVHCDGARGTPRGSRAGAVGDLIPVAPGPRQAPGSALVAARADGKVEIAGVVVDMERLHELHAQVGKMLRAAEGGGEVALERLATRLDMEFRDGLVVVGQGGGERPTRCVIRRADDGGVVCRVSRFAFARLLRRTRRGDVIWRGRVVVARPDELLGARFSPTSRHVTVPDVDVQRLMPAQIAGPAEIPSCDRGNVHPARMPSARPLSTLEPGVAPQQRPQRRIAPAELAKVFRAR